jgi:transcription elongation factor SPT4
MKTFDQFFTDGCQNCDHILHMKGDKDRIFDCTSKHFEGLVALMTPDKSWVARWQRIDQFQKGLYAVIVRGRLPDHIVHILDQAGTPYRSRDEPFRP